MALSVETIIMLGSIPYVYKGRKAVPVLVQKSA